MANEIMEYRENARATLVEIRADNVNYPRLRSYSRELGIKGMMVCVLKAYNLFGVDAEQEAASNLAIELYDELLNDPEELRTYNLTFEEIIRAIKKAAMGGSVEFYGKVSFHFLYKAIMHYVKGEGLQANTQMLKQAEAHRVQVVTDATKLLIAPHTKKMIGG
jgi:Cu/Ag efflux pump CusA